MRVVVKNFKQWSKGAQDTARALTAPDVIRDQEVMLTRRWQRLFREVFDSEGAKTASGRWARLSPAYAAQKARRFPGKTILRRKDRMFRSFVTRRENVAFAARHRDGFLFKYGSLVPVYPELHQTGTPFMPARKIIDPTRQQLTGVAAAMGRTLVEGMFRRKWFDRRSGLVFRNTGFDIIDG